MRIAQRFNGPPGSGHGGVACGVFAAAVDPRAATVRLLQPPLLETDLEQQPSEDGVTIVGPDGDVALVRSAPSELDVEPLPWLADEAVIAAQKHWADNMVSNHPFPTCFGCGHGRVDHDGLELYAGEVPDMDLCAAFWTPDKSLTDDGVSIADWAVWAAVDCPSLSAASFDPETTKLLGELTVRISGLPEVGERYQIVARHRGAHGRRFTSEVAVVAGDGQNLATGIATWIALPPTTDDAP